MSMCCGFRRRGHQAEGRCWTNEEIAERHFARVLLRAQLMLKTEFKVLASTNVRQ